MNSQYKNICRNPMFIISFALIMLIEFVSTKSTREIISTTNLNFYFSGISVFYSYGIIVSCFIALKYNLMKIFENKVLIIKSGNIFNWFNYIIKNSNILVLIIVLSFSLPSTVIGIIYRGFDFNELSIIVILILVQFLGLLLIDQIFNFIYIINFNNFYSALVTIALVILPEYISKYLVKFNTLTNLMFIEPNNIYNFKHIMSIIVFDIFFIIIIININKKNIYSLNKKDINF